MGKLRSLTQGKVIGVLESNGFRKIRSRKHITYKRTTSEGNVLTTWVPLHRDVSLFVIKSIIKQT